MVNATETRGGIWGLIELFAPCRLPEESSVHSDSTVEADTNADAVPAPHKQPNLTLELFPNHSENLESAKKVRLGSRMPAQVRTSAAFI